MTTFKTDGLEKAIARVVQTSHTETYNMERRDVTDEGESEEDQVSISCENYEQSSQENNDTVLHQHEAL